MGIERLGLTDVGPMVSSKVKHLLRELPDGLVDSFDIIRDPGDVLGGSVVCNDHVHCLIILQPNIDKLMQGSHGHIETQRA